MILNDADSGFALFEGETGNQLTTTGFAASTSCRFSAVIPIANFNFASLLRMKMSGIDPNAGEPCHRYKNHPDWIPSLFSFTKRNRQLEARNLKRFERSQKRLRRFVVHATSSSAPSTMPSNSSSSSESSSKPSSIAPAQSCTVRGHFPTPPIPGMPTQAFVVNSDGSLGSTYTTTVKGPTFLLCNGSGTPRLVNQELETNQVVILLSPAGASPAAVAPTTTVMSNNTPIIHHIVTSTQLGPSELPRALPASGGSEQEKAAPQIRVTKVWSTASESTLSTSEEEAEPGVVREGDTDEQMSPLTEGSYFWSANAQRVSLALEDAERAKKPYVGLAVRVNLNTYVRLLMDNMVRCVIVAGMGCRICIISRRNRALLLRRFLHKGTLTALEVTPRLVHG
ncbi:uncharacterized protein LOC119431942 [Dermacentor silvarum]|uniref:uncharacterized protein LOC119431942 n=1 Tax=Dermacentor silvarum TaxID=543639 RepID=UPI0021016CC5|nr:uncharacterized protein LOC119431942 [Dermacentor silvarum]